MSDSPVPPSHGVVRIGNRRFDFGTLSFDHGARLSPKAAHVLWLLVREAGRTVAKDVLLDTAWPGQVRVPDVLVQAVGEIRRGLGDTGRDGAVRTIPKLGYRLQRDVQWLEGGDPGLLPLPTPRQTPRTYRAALALGTLALVVLLAAVGWRLASRPQSADATVAGAAAAPSPAVRIEHLQHVVAESGADIHPAPHPDGRQLAYVRKNPDGWYRVQLRTLDGSPAREIESSHDGDDVFPAWSHDGTRIAFQRFRPGTCHYVLHEVDGGHQHEVGRCFADYASALSFSADDSALLVTGRVASSQSYLHLVRLELATGEIRLLDYARDANRVDHTPKLSPDRRELAFLRVGARGPELMLRKQGEFEVVRVAAIGSGIVGFDWLEDGSGWLVGAFDGAEPGLWQVERGGAMRVLPGPPLQRLARSTRSGLWLAQLARVGATIHAVDEAGTRNEVTHGSAQDLRPTPGPAGQLLFVSTRSGHPELWLQETLGGPARQLTSHRGGSFGRAHWDASGAIRFTQIVEGRWGAWRLDPGQEGLQPLAEGLYQLKELVPFGDELFAIGVPGGEGGSELLRLGRDGDALRVEPTGIAAVDARAGAGSLWLRQSLRRGVRELDPETLSFTGRELGSHHFTDWLVEEQGLLHWAAVDAVRTELHFLPFDGGPARVVLPGDDSYSITGGLARTADGRLLFSRLRLDDIDIVSFRLSPEAGSAR